MKALRRTWVTVACIASTCVVAWPRAQGSDPCSGRGTTVWVGAASHRLHLCEAGATVERYRVALGRGGLDKRREGDGRTPLGTYRLERAHRSASFHRFLHVGYPTAAQRRSGYTGYGIGVHGPSRAARALRRASTLVDWTQGCIAVGTDADIDAIARWVEMHRVRTITVDDDG